MTESTGLSYTNQILASTCTKCHRRSFPPSRLSRCCSASTKLDRIAQNGILIEFSESYISGSPIVYGLVDFSGIRLMGDFSPSDRLKVGMEVRIRAIGLQPDGRPFYSFSPSCGEADINTPDP